MTYTGTLRNPFGNINRIFLPAYSPIAFSKIVSSASPVGDALIFYFRLIEGRSAIGLAVAPYGALREVFLSVLSVRPPHLAEQPASETVGGPFGQTRT